MDNLAIRNIQNLKAIWNFWPTRFITYLSIALNYHFYQLKVLGYHLFNLTVHIGSTILVYWLILLTFSTPKINGEKITRYSRLIALFVSLVFLTHPIQTQAVTYIIQRTTSLAALFYLVSLSLYVKSRLLEQKGQGSLASRLFYCGSLIALVLDMFSKEMTITLPFMILLYEICFLKTKERLNWKSLLPFFLALLIIPLTMYLTKSVDLIGMRRILGESPNISSWHYLLTQLRIIVTYLRLLFIPINQNFLYDYPIAKSLLELPILASFILLGSILAIAARLFAKYSLISFGIFWFFLTLLPESSVIPIRSVIFEHRLYLPMVGFSLFLVSLIYYLFENKSLKSMVIALLIIISCYAVLTYKRNLIWKDELILWNDVVYKSPKAPASYSNRGVAYAHKGNFTQAISDFTKAVEINPKYSNVYYNRGLVYHQQSNLPQAISDYTKAIEINPNYAEAYCNRGLAYDNQGNFTQAISDYNKVIEINPNLRFVYFNRGGTYANQGNLPQAILDYTKAIEINPYEAVVYNDRGVVCGKQGNFTQAISDFTKAIEVNPNFAGAYNNLGHAYYKQSNFIKAISDYNKAIELNPNDAEFYSNRGVAYKAQGNLAQAISDYNKAIEINPNLADVYNNRGLAYYDAKEFDKAWTDVHKAESLGFTIYPESLANLKKASGRDK
ncbi:MAG: tetratricopeptide repeat protein [Candidatus Omnitrophica bacterium]|nr:tetratricopeptide repeat protein [Candidatus Omnitrophota bacterium]